MATLPSHTFIAHVEDRPGVLNRVISLFRRRGYNIESLNVARTDRPEISRITLVVKADDDTARRLEANLYKLVNVLYVEDISHVAALARELTLVKVQADADSRPRILELCERFGARPLDVTPSSMVVELTGTLEKVDALILDLKAFGIIEMVRTGAVAMTRGERSPLAEMTDRVADEVEAA